MKKEEFETVGIGCYFDDLPLGRKFKTVGRTITEADIVAFVNTTGMTEVLFTNIEFLRHESDLTGRVAPGAFVFCIAEGLLTQATMQGTGLAFLNMECEVIESRRSKSRPTRGLVRTRNRIYKRHAGTGIYPATHGQSAQQRTLD